MLPLTFKVSWFAPGLCSSYCESFEEAQALFLEVVEKYPKSYARLNVSYVPPIGEGFEG